MLPIFPPHFPWRKVLERGGAPVDWSGLATGRLECHYQCSVSILIVPVGVIIIVIADRAVRGPEQTGLLADCQPDFSLSLYQGIPLLLL